MADRYEWDVSLTQSAPTQLRIALPTVLSGPLILHGFDRAHLTVTPEGILVRPYKAESIVIPEGWK